MNTVALYSRFETSFQSGRGCENPVQDFSVEVQFEYEGAQIPRTRSGTANVLS